MDHQTESEFLEHQPCEKCGSSDAKGIFDDGHGWCFACDSYFPAEGEPVKAAPTTQGTYRPSGEFEPLLNRGISERVVRKMDYRVDHLRGAHVAVYHDPKTGEAVAAKVRRAGKQFAWEGDPKRAGLFGQHLWSSGKRIVLTEGEIDALSVSETQGQGKWPVCSLPNGAAAAKRDCAKQLEFLESFEEVILMFDTDEAGSKAAVEVAELLSPGKARIATLPLKDANEVLTQGNPGDITSAMWNAKPYRPDGIVNGADLWDLVTKQEEQSEFPYPYPCLNAVLYGLRPAEIVTVVSGSGMGKSAFVKEVVYHQLMQGHTVGAMFLEESTKRTIQGMMGLHLNKPIHLPDQMASVKQDELRAAFDATAGTGRLYLMDHFGSAEPDDRLWNQIRFFVKGCGCNVLLLDHISILVSGLDTGQDERRNLDYTMTQLRTLAQELNVVFLLVSHLRRPQGQGHEEGGRTSLSDLRGSASLAQLSDQVIGLERDQQSETNAHLTTLRILKNRFSGETGVVGFLDYDTETGRLYETNAPASEDAGSEPEF